jgi:hypothetical protein
MPWPALSRRDQGRESTGAAQRRLFPRGIGLLRFPGGTTTVGQHPVALVDVGPTGTDVGPMDSLHRGSVGGRPLRGRYVSRGSLRKVAAMALTVRRLPGTAVAAHLRMPGCGIWPGGPAAFSAGHGKAVPTMAGKHTADADRNPPGPRASVFRQGRPQRRGGVRPRSGLQPMSAVGETTLAR